MDDILLNFIVIPFFVVLIIVIVWLVRRKQVTSEQDLRHLAEANGWGFESIREPLAWGTRFKTTQWTLEALSKSLGNEGEPSSSTIAMTTLWQADAPGSTFLIGSRTSSADLGEWGGSLMRQILAHALGPYADGLIEVQAGSEAFRQRYMVWAQEPRVVERLITPTLESALLKWSADQLLVKRTPQELSILLNGVHLKKPQEIGALVRTGELLLTQENWR